MDAHKSWFVKFWGTTPVPPGNELGLLCLWPAQNSFDDLLIETQVAKSLPIRSPDELAISRQCMVGLDNEVHQ